MEGKNIKIIDQNLLPDNLKIIKLKNTEDVVEAIKSMKVRGAGAIAATGAYGLAQSCLLFKGKEEEFKQYIKNKVDTLIQTRPTAYELKNILTGLYNKLKESDNLSNSKKQLLINVKNYIDNSINNCRLMGEYGEKLIKDKSNILTHCNAGGLAFIDNGTALSPIFTAKKNGKKIFVFVSETRPRLQGAKLTAFELAQENIPHIIITDNAAGFYMQKNKIHLVIVGADRIAVNGDVVNKIGTYEKAVLAKENNIPFYVAAPLATIDPMAESGENIPIEYRNQDEVLLINKKRISHKKAIAENPSFDITPAKYITGIITERGIIKANKSSIMKLLKNNYL